jgi:hypothetical protein
MLDDVADLVHVEPEIHRHQHAPVAVPEPAAWTLLMVAANTVIAINAYYAALDDAKLPLTPTLSTVEKLIVTSLLPLLRINAIAINSSENLFFVFLTFSIFLLNVSPKAKDNLEKIRPP